VDTDQWKRTACTPTPHWCCSPMALHCSASTQGIESTGRSMSMHVGIDVSDNGLRGPSCVAAAVGARDDAHLCGQHAARLRGPVPLALRAWVPPTRRTRTHSTGWTLGSVALSLCTTAYPIHTRFANIFGASISETTMRPSPRWTRHSPRTSPSSVT
jgi:hypothetical protein